MRAAPCCIQDHHQHQRRLLWTGRWGYTTFTTCMVLIIIILYKHCCKLIHHHQLSRTPLAWQRPARSSTAQKAHTAPPPHTPHRPHTTTSRAPTPYAPLQRACPPPQLQTALAAPCTARAPLAPPAPPRRAYWQHLDPHGTAPRLAARRPSSTLPRRARHEHRH